jgi:hypothetical protein
MNPTSPAQAHPWIVALRAGLDELEKALLAGDAGAVERTSAQVQGVLQHAPKTAAFANFVGLRSDMLEAAQRFGRLRQAVLRLQAQNQRELRSLMPGQAPQTYGRLAGQAPSTGGAGRAYLSA